jgi:hypothetical protein
MRFDRRRLFVVLIAVVALCLAVAAEAAEKKSSVIPRPDPPDSWHRLTHWDETSTSKCLGKPTTPLCALDTLLACFLRRTWEICHVAFRSMEADDDFLRGRTSLGGYLEYRVDEARPLRKADIPYHDRDFRKDVHRGDLLIRFQRAWCSGFCSESSYEPVKLCVYKKSGSWTSCGWFCDDEKQVCP